MRPLWLRTWLRSVLHGESPAGSMDRYPRTSTPQPSGWRRQYGSAHRDRPPLRPTTPISGHFLKCSLSAQNCARLAAQRRRLLQPKPPPRRISKTTIRMIQPVVLTTPPINSELHHITRHPQRYRAPTRALDPALCASCINPGHYGHRGLTRVRSCSRDRPVAVNKRILSPSSPAFSAAD